MKSRLEKCPFFRSTLGCIPDGVCQRSGKSRTFLPDGSFIKPEGCEYPDITNNECEVEKIAGVLPSRTKPVSVSIGGRAEIIFHEPKK